MQQHSGNLCFPSLRVIIRDLKIYLQCVFFMFHLTCLWCQKCCNELAQMQLDAQVSALWRIAQVVLVYSIVRATRPVLSNQYRTTQPRKISTASTRVEPFLRSVTAHNLVDAPHFHQEIIPGDRAQDAPGWYGLIQFWELWVPPVCPRRQLDVKSEQDSSHEHIHLSFRQKPPWAVRCGTAERPPARAPHQ